LTTLRHSFILEDHQDGGLAEELGTALQKLLRGCEALTHLQIPLGNSPKKIVSIENQKQMDSMS
jgi:hypothetical protein